MSDLDKIAAVRLRKREWLEKARSDPVRREAMRIAANASAKKSREKRKEQIRESQKVKRLDPEYRAKEAAHRREWQLANREKLAEARRARRENPVLAAEDQAKRECNRARKAELDRALRSCPEWKARKAAYKRLWESDPINRSRRNQRLADKRRASPLVKLQQNTRSVVRSMIKNGSKGCLRHLRYTIPELCNHLEKQFLDGMTWDNYGPVWHIDHVLPIASFQINAADPGNCPEFQACWALTNLRPLWKEANLSKSSVRILLI